jgi:VanZ family protein
MSWELIVFMAASGAVAIGCLLPAGWLPPLPHDKLLHFGAFALLTTLALRIEPDWIRRGGWLASLLLAGLVIELLQQRIPGRSFCWRDMAANTAGIALVTVVFWLASAV